MTFIDVLEIGILVYVAMGAIYIYFTDKKDNEGS